MKNLLLICLLLWVLASAGAFAQVPQTMSYQGVLKDDAGVIVPNGTYDLTFRIYNVETDGSALWTEGQAIYVAAGIVNAVLGAVTPIALDFDEQYWLGVTINGGDELAPRTRLTGVPYALNARAVLGTHNVFPDSGRVGIGTTDPERPVHIVSPDVHIMEIEGTAAGAWAALAINGSHGSNPCIEYFYNDGYEAKHYIDSYHKWFLDLGVYNVLCADDDTRNVGIGGITDPVERLDVNGAVRLGTTDSTHAGTIRWTGTDFEGYDGGTWLSLTAGGSGSLPPGSLGQTLRHNGSGWVASSFLYNDGDRVGIGTTSPSAELEVIGDNMTNHFKLTAPTGAGPSLYFNAVNKDWTIYGSNPGSSVGDRKLVFRDFSAATDRMVIDENGRVGIGESDPTAPLTILGGNWDLNGSDGDLRIGDDNHKLKIGIATGGLGAGTAGLRIQGGNERLVLGAGLAEALWIENDGTVSIGSETQTGELQLYRNGISSYQVRAYSNEWGGNVDLYDENGMWHSGIQGDVDGEGGYLYVKRNTVNSGFTVDGNYNGTEDPRVTISGASRAAAFNMDQSGDASVQLPSSSISSVEILDEAGCSSGIGNCEIGFPLSGGSVEPILTRSITVPDAGYVLAVSTMQVDIAHSSGSLSSAAFGVSEVPDGFVICQDVGVQLPSSCGSGTYQIPVSNNRIFTVDDAGTYTYYLVGYEVAGSFTVYDCQLSFIYVPTAYGLVSSPSGVADASDRAGTGPGLVSADIDAERLESIAANEARLERELAQLREQFETLKREIEMDTQRR